MDFGWLGVEEGSEGLEFKGAENFEKSIILLQLVLNPDAFLRCMKDKIVTKLME